MAIYKGSNKVVKLYKGSTPIIKRYKGTQLIYQAEDSSSGDTTSDNSFTITCSEANSNYYVKINNSETYPITATTMTFENLNLTNTINMFSMVNKLLIDVKFNNLDTSNCTSMSYMFADCTSLTSLDLSGWDVSNVTHFMSTFSYCTSLETLNVTGWIGYNNSSELMIDGCKSLSKLILGEVSQTTYDLWVLQLDAIGITDQVTIEATIV